MKISSLVDGGVVKEDTGRDRELIINLPKRLNFMGTVVSLVVYVKLAVMELTGGVVIVGNSLIGQLIKAIDVF